MKLPELGFLTFAELAGKWGVSEAHLHHLIADGEIVPAITLTDQERYPGGEYCGGYFVGDIEESIHKSYSEYYVGMVIGEENHYENWPQCSSVVFCHCPTIKNDGNYSFVGIPVNVTDDSGLS
jgi:hypothetical protein